jgi:hypothetical protein
MSTPESVERLIRQTDRQSGAKFIICSLVILILSIAFLVFACTRYYIEPSLGIVDQIAALTAYAFWIGLGCALIWRSIARKERLAVICFALIAISIIATYKSIKLLGEVSSAKNAIKKFSTILNDVNEGRQISNEKITETQYGESAGLVELINGWAHDIQMDGEKLNKELENCNYASITNPKTLFQSVLSSQCPFNFERSEVILRKYEEIISNRFDEFETRIRTSNLPERLKERALSGFNKTKAENLKGSLDVIKLIEAYVSEAKSFLAFMKEKQEDWTYENGQFSFQSNENASIFNSHIRNFQRLTKEMASLKEQVNIEFVQKQKELEQLKN